MDFTAKLIEVREPVTGEGKNGTAWRRQEYIFETESQYPRKICVQVWGDGDRLRSVIPNPDVIQVNQRLTVSFDLESREFNNRWYTDVRAWRITLPATEAPAQGGRQPNFAEAPAPATPAAPAAAPAANIPAAPAFAQGEEGGDDLPF